MTQQHDADLPLQLGELHKVLPAGGPVLTAGRGDDFAYTECSRCRLRAIVGQTPPDCPATECDIGPCPLKASA